MSLINNISEFRKYITIDANAKMDTLRPYIEEAEQLYIVDLLGRAFYDEFAAKYADSVKPTSPVALNAENVKLLGYIQRCLAYYSQLHSIIHLAGTFGDMGIRQHRADDSDAAPRWLQEKLALQALKNGDIHADKLLEFLETNSTAGNDFQTWFASAANTKLSGCIVYSTAIASKYIRINNSRRVFIALRDTIKQIEAKYMPKLIGLAQYAELVQQLTTGGVGIPTPANVKLIDKLAPIIAKRALYMQVQFMRVQIEATGLFIYSGTDDLIKLGQLATDADVKILRQQLMDGELGYLADEQELNQFILDNIEDYPEIKASTVYTVQPDPGPTWVPKNDPNSKHFVV